MVEESQILRARTEQTGRFHAVVATDRPPDTLAGVDVSRLPDLAGYLATAPRAGAEVVLAAPNGDPLLAEWTWGVGRVAAWTSDSGEAWAAGWNEDPVAAALWRRLVYHLAPDPAAHASGVEVRSAGRHLELVVHARDAAGELLDLADVALRLGPTGAARSLRVPQVAPGRYELALEAPADPVPGTVRVEAPGEAQAIPVVVRAPTAPEALPVRGASVLPALVAAGGGRMLAPDEVPAWLRGAATGHLALAPWLLALAAVAWMVDVARQVGGWSVPTGWRPGSLVRSGRAGTDAG